MSKRYSLFIATLALAGAAAGQTQVDLKTQSKSVDFSAASSTKPFETGVTLPSACAVGQMYFLTSAASGLNSYGCVSTNTWAQQSGGAQSTIIKSSGTLVGSSGVIDISAGLGGLLATSYNGQEISVQLSVDTSVIPTRADEQAGTVLFCSSTSLGAPGLAYACSMTPTLTAYTTGMVINWNPNVNNSGGATTLDVDTLGAISILEADGVTVPGSSTIVAGQLYQLWYDGTVFRLLAPPPGQSGGMSGSGAFAANAEYSTSRAMDSTYCPGWLGTFVGSSALTFTLAAPIPGCAIGLQNNTSQPMTIDVTTNAVTLNEQTSNGTIPACASPANGCPVVLIKANGATSWDSSDGGFPAQVRTFSTTQTQDATWCNPNGPPDLIVGAGSGITFNLAATPVAACSFIVQNSSNSGTLTINGNGNTIDGVASNVVLPANTGIGASSVTIWTNGAGNYSTSGNNTNAGNLSAGTVAAARGGAGTVTGALKANGSGTVSQAACADLSNGAGGCSMSITAGGALSGTLPSPSLVTKYQTFLCEPGLGDGSNAMTQATYLQSGCFNEFGATFTITGVWCYTDNAGTSTLNITNGAGTALLTGTIACGNTFPGAAGTQSGTITIANGDGIKFTFAADGISKQTTWMIAGTR